MAAAPDLEGRLESVRAGISDAARAAGRNLDSITTVVVTKFHPAALVRELHALGVRDFGESRNQDAEPKAAELGDLELTWHFVGQLQTNKARRVARFAHIIHSIDREPLVDALRESDAGVFLQVDLGDEPGRGGVAPSDLLPLAERVVGMPSMRLLGLMTVAPRSVEPRPTFARLRELGESVRAIAPDAVSLSMGMSGDYADAIAEGATHLRIGTAITGNRPTAG